MCANSHAHSVIFPLHRPLYWKKQQPQMRELCDMCLVCVRLGNQVDFCQYLSEARLAQSVEHETLNLRVVGSSPTLGAIIFFSFFCGLYSLFFFPFLFFGACRHNWSIISWYLHYLRESIAHPPTRLPLPHPHTSTPRRPLQPVQHGHTHAHTHLHSPTHAPSPAHIHPHYSPHPPRPT